MNPLYKGSSYQCRFIFDDACANGYIDTLKMLYSLDPNLFKGNENSFNISCEYGHIEVRGSTIPEQTLAGSRKMVTSIGCGYSCL